MLASIILVSVFAITVLVIDFLFIYAIILNIKETRKLASHEEEEREGCALTFIHLPSGGISTSL